MLLFALWAPSTNGQIPSVSLTLIPPSPITEQITLELRGALRNVSTNRCEAEFSFYLDKEAPENLLGRQKIEVSPPDPLEVIMSESRSPGNARHARSGVLCFF